MLCAALELVRLASPRTPLSRCSSGDPQPGTKNKGSQNLLNYIQFVFYVAIQIIGEYLFFLTILYQSLSVKANGTMILEEAISISPMSSHRVLKDYDNRPIRQTSIR